MKWLTIVIQVVLVGATILLVVKLVQLELDDRRWWRENFKNIKGKSAWKP